MAISNIRPLSLVFFISVTICFLISTGCEGPTGPEGPQGSQGEQGPVGPAGEDGSMIFSDDGAPASDIGDIGDYYLDTSTGELYGPKTSSGWGSPSIDLMGEDGEDGSQILAGNGAPDASLGNTGDFYLDKSSYGLYGPKTDSGWGNPLNLKGADGNANVTLYIFDAPAFTDQDPDHTFIIDNLTREEAMQSSWEFALIRGAKKLFIPGKLTEGIPPYEFAVGLLYDSSTQNLEIRVEFKGGGANGQYFPDQLHVFRIEPTTTINSKLNFDNYTNLVDHFGKENIMILDKTTE